MKGAWRARILLVGLFGRSSKPAKGDVAPNIRVRPISSMRSRVATECATSSGPSWCKFGISVSGMDVLEDGGFVACFKAASSNRILSRKAWT